MEPVTPTEMTAHLRVPGTYLVCGMSNSGKTVGTQKLLQMMPRRFDRIIVFSQTAYMTGDWKDVTPYVYSEPNYELIARVQTLQEEIKGRLTAEGKDPASALQIAFVFDDCAGVLETQERGHPMNKLVTMSRHFNISLFILVQAMTQISPVIRKNSHYVVVTKIHGTDYDLLYALQTHYDNKKDFTTGLRANMKDYNLIAFNMDCYTPKPIMVLSGRYKLRQKRGTDTDPRTAEPREDQASVALSPLEASAHDCGL